MKHDWKMKALCLGAASILAAQALAGCGAVKNLSESASQEFSKAASDMAEDLKPVSEAASQAAEAASQAAEKVQEAAGKVGEKAQKVGEKAQEAGEKASEALEDAKEKSEGTGSMAGSTRESREGTTEAESTEAETAEAGQAETEPETGAAGSEKKIGDAKKRIRLLKKSESAGDFPETATYGYYDMAFADPEAYPGLSAALAEQNGRARTAAASWTEELSRQAGGVMDSAEEYTYYSANMNIVPVRTDEAAFTYVRSAYRGGNGLKGEEEKLGVNLDPLTGEELVLRDVVADMEAFRAVMKAEFSSLFRDEQLVKLAEEMLAEETGDGTEPSRSTFSWVLGYDGLSVYLNTLENFAFFPSVGDSRKIFIPFSGNERVFRPEYTERPDRYVTRMDVRGDRSESFYRDVDGDGKEEELWLATIPDEWYIHDIALVIDGEPFPLTAPDSGESFYAFTAAGYLITDKAGDLLLWILTTHENDAENMAFYRVAGVPEYLGSSGESVSCGILAAPGGEEDWYGVAFTDPERFRMTTGSDILGTTSLVHECRIGADGMPEALEDGYGYVAERVLTLKRPFKAPGVSEEGVLTGKAVNLSAGDKVTLHHTDGTGYVDVRREDGTFCRIHVTMPEEPDWVQKVDGIPIEDLFDGIMFAG